MKKLLLSCLTLLAMGATAYADDEIVTYEPDQEFTSIEAIGDNLFAICNLAEGKGIANTNNQNLTYDEYAKAFTPNNQAFCWKLESLADNADESVRNCYVLELVKLDGSSVNIYGQSPSYLNAGAPDGFNGCFVLGNKGDQLGQDAKYCGVWEVEYVAGMGFTLKNKGCGGYFVGVNPGPRGNEPVYWNFCTLKENKVVNNIPAGTYDATDANTDFFADFTTFNNEATYDPDTKVFTGNCGWKWANGTDFGAYQYIVITVAQNVLNKGCQVHIKDASGKEVSGDEYGADFMNMWIGAWNNHNCLKIDLEKLRAEKMFDLHNVAEIMIEAGDGLILGNAYATNQVPENNKNWNNEENGDYKVTIDNNTYGTVCLPFAASVAGAYVYEISGANADGVELKMYNNILEAGKPYFFKSNVNESGNVYFYKATAATVDAAGTNNGLVGTFQALTSESDDWIVLKNNELTWGNSVAANSAYVDIDAIQGVAADATILYNNVANGIKSVNATAADGVVFDLQGRRVAQPQKGLYIMNGKKTVVK